MSTTEIAKSQAERYRKMLEAVAAGEMTAEDVRQELWCEDTDTAS